MQSRLSRVFFFERVLDQRNQLSEDCVSRDTVNKYNQRKRRYDEKTQDGLLQRWRMIWLILLAASIGRPSDIRLLVLPHRINEQVNMSQTNQRCRAVWDWADCLRSLYITVHAVSWIKADCFQKHCNYMYTVSQKTALFSFEHNLGKYCLILIILSLLQTEINCDQAYPKSTTAPQIWQCTILYKKLIRD